MNNLIKTSEDMPRWEVRLRGGDKEPVVLSAPDDEAVILEVVKRGWSDRVISITRQTADSPWTEEMVDWLGRELHPGQHRCGARRWARSSRYARVYYPCGAEVEIRNEYNGTDKKAFGGAKNWKAVTMMIRLPEGETGAEIAMAMKDFADNLLHTNGWDKE